MRFYSRDVRVAMTLQAAARTSFSCCLWCTTEIGADHSTETKSPKWFGSFIIIYYYTLWNICYRNVFMHIAVYEIINRPQAFKLGVVVIAIRLSLQLNGLQMIFCRCHPKCRRRHYVFGLSVRRVFVCSSRQILLLRLEQSRWNLQRLFNSSYWWPD